MNAEEQELIKIFTNHYLTDWNGHSGWGSSVDFNKEYIVWLRAFIKTNRIRSVVDLGCGDWQFSFQVFPESEKDQVKYIGYDCVSELVERNNAMFPYAEFRHMAFTPENVNKLPDADMYILKDVLQHWSNDRIHRFLTSLRNAKKNFKYIVIVNCAMPCHANGALKKDGHWHSLPPNMYPLKDFDLRTVYKYHTKEVSLLLPRF